MARVNQLVLLAWQDSKRRKKDKSLGAIKL
jgi:hypothetical protein